MNKSWKTTLGGAISILGTSLLGIGVLTQLSQLSPTTSNLLSPHQLAALWYVALTGFILSAVGKAVTALFAADDAQVKNLAQQLKEVPAAIQTGNTEHLERAQVETKENQTDK